MTAVLWLGVSLLCTAFAQLAFKSHFRTCNQSRLPLLPALAILLFVGATWSTYQALHGLSLSTVYIATAITQILVVLLSLSLLGERYNARQYAGFALILVGVLLYNL